MPPDFSKISFLYFIISSNKKHNYNRWYEIHLNIEMRLNGL